MIFLIFLIMMAWTFSGWPRIWTIPFPPEIQEAHAASTHLYIQNAAAGYTPTTKRGAWDVSTSTVVMKLDQVKAGASATSAIAEASATNNWDVLLARFVSEPLQSDTSFTTSDTVQWIMGVMESSNSANDMYHVHIFITQGDTDNLRGTLLTDSIGATEWPTAAKGRGEGTKTLSAVSALAGDRIVVEVGYQAQNTSSTSYTGTLYYGATGATDLTSGSTAVTTNPGWIEFSNTFALKHTTTLGDGTDPSNSTVAPGSTNNYLGQFTLVTDVGTDSVTALTVTTANTTAIASMQIWDDAMTTQYFTTVSSPVGDAWGFSSGTVISVSTSGSFRVIFNAKASPPLLGGTYAVTGTVTSYTCMNTKSGTDTDSATITVNNPENISFTITDYGSAGINFGNLDMGATNQPADQIEGTGAVTLTVGDETNVAVNIQLKGNDFTGASTIPISNVKYNNANTTTGASTLTTSYVTWYSVPAYTADTRECYHWISIPSGQTGGGYTSTFYYQAVGQ